MLKHVCPPELQLEKLRLDCQGLHQAGYNVVVAVSRYDNLTSRFETILNLTSVGLEQDHAFLDLLRELMLEWSRQRHKEQPSQPTG